jgi:ubiquinone/menaquinone biosynthesis C-methylase UbiE
LAQAKEQASIADVGEIHLKDANVESLPFEDKIFDVVLSRFGQMFTLNPQIDIKEIIHVTKPGGCIAFSAWPSELLNGKLFKQGQSTCQQILQLLYTLVINQSNNNNNHLLCNGEIQRLYKNFFLMEVMMDL